MKSYHPSWTVAVWIVCPLLLALGGLGHFVATTKEDAALNAVFIIASCALGWAAGMILSPDSRVEERKFTGLWKGISLFVSGYLISKIDPLIDAMLKPEVVLVPHAPIQTYRLLACPAAVILTAILTYVIRMYAFSAHDSERAA